MITVTAFTTSLRKAAHASWMVLAGAAILLSAPLAAQQIKTVDPNAAIDGDLAETPGQQPAYQYPVTQPSVAATASAVPAPAASQPSMAQTWPDPAPAASPPPAASSPAQAAGQAAANGNTYAEDDLIGAAEGVFGKGAEGLAKMIKGLLAKQGEPNAYIVGREAGGAFVVGVRYGSGTLYHKVEGKMPVYWTGPSIGFDAGANAANTFVLVYNLYDTDDLFKRFPAGEGQAYVVGGLTASYLRRGNIVLIPIRVGAGLRLGINAGYMKFSKKQRWLPF